MGTNEGFKISDKRATHDNDERPAATEPRSPSTPAAESRAGSSPSSPPPHPRAGGTAGMGADRAAPFASDDEQPLSLLELNSFEITNFFLGLMIQKAWIALGVVGNPSTGRLERDFAEARRFIDLVSLIAGHMQGKWGHPEFEQEVQTQLTNLRLNFAKLAPTP